MWSEKEARKDFQRVANLDITLSRLVYRDLNLLSERMKEKNWEDKERYWNILKHKQENEPEEEEKDIAVMHVKEESPGEHSQTPEALTEAEEELKKSAAKENKHDIKSESDRRTAALTKGKDWQQMLRLIMLLQDEGNFNVKEHRYTEASAKFKDALAYIDHLQTKVSLFTEKAAYNTEL